MTDTYKETNTYTSPVYDEYDEYSYDHEDEVYEDYPDDELYHDTGEDIVEEIHYQPTGKRRVIRLLLIILLVLMVVAVLIFGIIPYVDAMSQSNVPPLPPAVQT